VNINAFNQNLPSEYEDKKEKKQEGKIKMAYKYSGTSTGSNASKKLTLRDYLNLNQLANKKKEGHANVEPEK
jgi:hypothetical protein